MTTAPNDAALAEAVYSRSLVEWANRALATDTTDGTARAALEACRHIAAAVTDEQGRLQSLLDTTRISAELRPASNGADQINALEAVVGSFDEARRFGDAAETAGYRRWEPWTGAARESFRRMSQVLTVAKPGDVTTVLNIRWTSASKLQQLPAVFRPNDADWRAVDLPSALWPLYFVTRPLRLVAERLRLRNRVEEGQLGPFLSTPASLLDALFEFAEIGPTDHVIDIGCGDGRLVIEAARRRGCRSTGIDSDPELVATARERVADAMLASQVTILEGDGETTDLNSATVVLLFLPADVTARMVPKLLSQLAPGVRIVAHEQHRISCPVSPDQTEVLLGADSVTVAHRWSVDATS